MAACILQLLNEIQPTSLSLFAITRRKVVTALEIASGTGQHIVELAAAVPSLIWQPSDIDETRLNSIASRSLAKQLPNLLPPIRLDVTDKGWSAFCPNQDFILLVNLLHLVSAAEVKAIISGISQSLAEDGRCVIYGPFMRMAFSAAVVTRPFIRA